MTIADFVALIQRRLRDDTGRQWTTEYVTDAVNAAFSALCHVLPQVYTEHRDLQLVGGTEQEIDSDLHRILHILHNKCPESGDAKGAIIKADLSIMDKVAPHWRQDDPRGYVIHYLLNPVDESKFYVWPPVEGGRDGDAPVEPTVLADPGPVQTAFPDNVTPFIPDAPLKVIRPDDYVNGGQGNAVRNSNYWAFDGPLNAPGLHVIDFSDFVSVGGTFRFFSGYDADTNSGATINQQPRRNLAFYDGQNLSGITSQYILTEDIEAAVAAGTPFMAFCFNTQGSGSQPTSMSSWMASPDDLPDTYLTTTSALPPTNYIRMTPGSAATNYVGSLFNATHEAALLSANLYTYLDAGNSTPVISIDTTKSIVSTDGTLEWDIDWSDYQGQFDQLYGNNSSPRVSTSADMFIVSKLAEPGVKGEIKWYKDPIRYGMHIAPASLRDATDDPTTQEEVDEYLASVAVYDQWVLDYAAWENSSLAAVIRGVFTKTPSIIQESALPVLPEVLAAPDANATQADIDAYNASYAAYDNVVTMREALTKNRFQLTDDIPFNASHELPLQEFALYYSLIRDDEQTANSGRAMQHWQNFFQLLNKREAAELLVKTGEEDSE